MLENIFNTLSDTQIYRKFMLKKLDIENKRDKQKFSNLINSIPDCNTEKEYNETFTYLLSIYEKSLIDIFTIKIKNNKIFDNEDLNTFDEIYNKYIILQNIQNQDKKDIDIKEVEEISFHLNILSLNLAVSFAVNNIQEKKVDKDFRYINSVYIKIVKYLQRVKTISLEDEKIVVS